METSLVLLNSSKRLLLTSQAGLERGFFSLAAWVAPEFGFPFVVVVADEVVAFDEVVLGYWLSDEVNDDVRLLDLIIFFNLFFYIINIIFLVDKR